MNKDVSLLINNGVNIEKSLELFGDMETYNDTLKDFLEDINDKELKIKNTKQMGDMANYSILVHGLKSDAKYFGFDTLADFAYNHEMASKQNNLYYVTENFDSLIKELDRIVLLVKKYLGLVDLSTTVTYVSTKKDKAIIVVDDSQVIKNFIQKIFNNEFDILMASDGVDALKIISENKDTKIVGMLLDLNMPNFNGFQVLEYFRNNNLFDRIPVSIITGVGNNDLIAKAFNYPIVDVIRKPFNEFDIKNVVSKTIQYAH